MRVAWIFFALVTSITLASEPQTDTNTVSSASDAFGITLGPETMGLYSPSSVRGFSPITAGNVRLDGLYFDLQGSMIDPLVTDTRIRVGLAAVNFAWPSPSGIVDYTLRQPKDEAARLTSILYTGPYGSRDVDLDGYTKFPEQNSTITAGASYHSDEFIPGQTARVASFGIIPRWVPNSDLSIRAFWGRQNATDIKPATLVYMLPGQTVPIVPERFYGSPWALSENDSEHYGTLVKATLSKHWSLHAGLFHSIYDAPRSFTDLYLDTNSSGVANHTLVAEPKQYYGSTSGEIQLSHRIGDKTWLQEIVFGIRGRSVNARYGGAVTFDYGTSVIGELQSNYPPPLYAFGSTTEDHIHDYSSGAAYTFQWQKHLSFTTALRREAYSNEINDPSFGHSLTAVKPWLFNSSLALFLTKRLTVFGTLTRGLEDSGVAPQNSVNRGEVLSATRSSQAEVGVKYSLSQSLTLLASAFDIRKPYFTLDEQDIFESAGEERHKGVEVSLAGQLTPDLHIVAGAVLMSPEVTVASTAQQPTGTRPVGQAGRIEQLGLDYRNPWFPALSVDCVVNAMGNRDASVDNRTRVPAYVTLDLGARYQLSLGQYPATLRFQVLDVTNASVWSVQSDGGLLGLASRRAWAYLIVDL